jgi:hypothetical protein
LQLQVAGRLIDWLGHVRSEAEANTDFHGYWKNMLETPCGERKRCKTWKEYERRGRWDDDFMCTAYLPILCIWSYLPT